MANPEKVSKCTVTASRSPVLVGLKRRLKKRKVKRRDGPRTPARLYTRAPQRRAFRVSLFLMPTENPIVPTEKSPRKPPVWEQRHRDKHPGSAPLPGHVDAEDSVHESRLHHAIFTLQARDYLVTLGGHHTDIVSPTELRQMLRRISIICKVSRTDRVSKVVEPITADTQMLATITLLRFLGELRRTNDLRKQVLTSQETEMLGDVCLAMASKYEEDRYVRPFNRILVLAGISRGEWTARKREMSVLEWRVFGAIRFRLTTATPMVFLHEYLALGVARGTFTQDEMESIGKLAMEMAITLVEKGRLSHATSAEIAAAAAYGATLQTLGAVAAGKMSTIVRLQWRVDRVREMVSLLCPGTTSIIMGRDPSLQKNAMPQKASNKKSVMERFQEFLEELGALVRRLDCHHSEESDASLFAGGCAFNTRMPTSQTKIGF